MASGIVGYGAYIPMFRIEVKKISEGYGKDWNSIFRSSMVSEKSVAGVDEDSITMSVEAASNALSSCEFIPENLGAIYFGSESPPYAVKSSTTTIAKAIGMSSNYFSSDLEFACKAGTSALQLCYFAASSGSCKYAIAIGSDVAQARKKDVLEYSTGAGAAAFIVGSNQDELIATIDATISFSSDTPDFWRRDGCKFPEHLGRFTGEPAYFYHTTSATEKILKKVSMEPSDFDFVIFHQPNGRFPLAVAKRLGFSEEQVLPGLMSPQIGNTYSANSLIGLAAVFDQAKPNQKILLVSYGSGSGSDAFVFTTTEKIKSYKNVSKVLDQVQTKQMISFDEYREFS